MTTKRTCCECQWRQGRGGQGASTSRASARGHPRPRRGYLCRNYCRLNTPDLCLPGNDSTYHGAADPPQTPEEVDEEEYFVCTSGISGHRRGRGGMGKYLQVSTSGHFPPGRPTTFDCQGGSGVGSVIPGAATAPEGISLAKNSQEDPPGYKAPLVMGQW